MEEEANPSFEAQEEAGEEVTGRCQILSRRLPRLR